MNVHLSELIRIQPDCSLVQGIVLLEYPKPTLGAKTTQGAKNNPLVSPKKSRRIYLLSIVG
jgi:hypothetical protein